MITGMHYGANVRIPEIHKLRTSLEFLGIFIDIGFCKKNTK